MCLLLMIRCLCRDCFLANKVIAYMHGNIGPLDSISLCYHRIVQSNNICETGQGENAQPGTVGFFFFLVL